MPESATVTVAVPDGITEAGLDPQVAPLGKPEQVIVTDWLNPAFEPTFTA